MMLRLLDTTPAGLSDGGHRCNINTRTWIQPGIIHPEGAPWTAMNWTLDKPYSCSSGAPSLITNRPSDTSTMKARGWVVQAEIDEGHRPGTTTSDAERLAELEKEVRELRRANAILKSASAFFAAELDRPQR